ncbi:hypothetical protein B0H19DRAFT_1339972, partial [Mycena capillaripes]
ILACVGFSRSTCFRVPRLWRTTGDVVRPQNRTGRPRLLHHDDIGHLISLIHHRPDWLLDELLHLLKDNRFISVHYTTIHRELQHAGMSTKKVLKKLPRSEVSPLDSTTSVKFLRFLPNTSPPLTKPRKRQNPGRQLG